MPNTFITSDTHFGHTNILKHCSNTRVKADGSAFTSIREHDELLIEQWNSQIDHGDIVYHLGDFAFLEPGLTKKVLNALNGRIHLLLGNHDHQLLKLLRADLSLTKVAMVDTYYELKLSNKRSLVLFHYPLEEWHGSHRGWWHLHGHCHGNLKTIKEGRRDVGVDCTGLKPLALEDLEVFIRS
jgi:calcineurin-like phosphoesterase family protein